MTKPSNYKLFKDVQIGEEFGFGDYFHWKNKSTTAVMEASGEEHPWDDNTIVCIFEDEDE